MNKFLICALAIACVSCGVEHEPAEDANYDSPILEASGNRMGLPAVARRNLGITFGKAQYRPVTATINLPGYFELLPSAQHHYPVPASGRVTIKVEALQEVRAGDLLFELDAPAWRDLQSQLAHAEAARLQAAAAHAQAKAARQAAGTLAADSANVFATREQAAVADLLAAEEAFARLLLQAATFTGLTKDGLLAKVDDKVRWRSQTHIPVHAVADGIIDTVDAASGNWVSEGTELVHVVQPKNLRFRAKALQADLIDHVRNGQLAHIAPPEGAGGARRGQTVQGRIRIGVTGDASSRTVDVFVDLPEGERPAWLRPQLAALAAVVVDGDPDAEELAIPQRAVIRDGLETVFFRRDPKDPDTVIRTEADLGPSDGRWVVVYSGIGEGHEVVVDGVYQLKLATTGQNVEAGHFHADGTWHAGEH